MGGMSDQYDDGPCDGDMNPGYGVLGSNLRQFHLRHDSGYTELPGGWCILNSQMTEPFGLPITAVRGGIKYPKPKGTTMPRMTKAQIEHELRTNDQLMETLRQRRADLQKQAQTAIPAEPRNFTMFTVAVRFSVSGKFYQFLILRSGDAYFTTGTSPEHRKFENWAALCAWLEGPEVFSHSNLEILQGAGKVVSFDSGAIEREGQAGEPPF